jgi:hypothetical protein
MLSDCSQHGSKDQSAVFRAVLMERQYENEWKKGEDMLDL